ncbi:hypothetical protein Caci_7019 [Catenulispora acidiphila DSM 44928]|uniref:Uncharacterized protein n=1 Tax=Catenulispora acidiphila (strain DSM 44928 / JCM 14897 / NBRC 102108 / NRRL B-24433 / ID139908) TaxID=479433 RepID=C7Q580_CATAD|nr:hypothetical protein [Catenulispora acidiphila]ACU75849.1 hypothetical protein Caci_7019 [Catenulispora acidiphila DSM 44928]
MVLLSGQQWPAFAVGSDGLLDYGATQQDELPLDTVGVAAADRGTLTDNDAGQPDSAFLNDDVTLAELKWIQNENDEVSPADVAMTISTELNPAPTYLPLKNGGELTLYGTRFSLRVSQSGRTFSVDDQGWAKIAGATSFQGGFTIEAVWMVAAIDPPDKTGKIEKIASNGGPVSMH